MTIEDLHLEIVELKNQIKGLSMLIQTNMKISIPSVWTVPLGPPPDSVTISTTPPKFNNG